LGKEVFCFAKNVLPQKVLPLFFTLLIISACPIISSKLLGRYFSVQIELSLIIIFSFGGTGQRNQLINIIVVN